MRIELPCPPPATPNARFSFLKCVIKSVVRNVRAGYFVLSARFLPFEIQQYYTLGLLLRQY